MRTGILVAAALVGGCNALLGLEPTALATYDAGPCDPVGHDEDGDDLDDACDPCPHAGDDCGAGQVVLFDSFADTADGWDPDRGTWQLSLDAYAQADPNHPSALAHRTIELPPEATVDATFRIGSVTPATDASVGLWFYAAIDIGEPEAYLCHLVRTATGDVQVRIERWVSDTFAVLSYTIFEDAAFELDQTFRLRAVRDLTGDDKVSCAAFQGALGTTVEAPDSVHDLGTIALRTSVMSAAVEHVAVITPEGG